MHCVKKGKINYFIKNIEGTETVIFMQLQAMHTISTDYISLYLVLEASTVWCQGSRFST